MKALVTGGAGFIGSHLVEGLLTRGYDVHVVDNLTNPGNNEIMPGTTDTYAIFWLPSGYHYSGGKPVDYQGKFWTLKDAVFDLPLYKGKPPRLFMGAHFPRMLRMCRRMNCITRGTVSITSRAQDSGRTPTLLASLNSCMTQV